MILVAAAVGRAAHIRLDRAIRVATGYVAHIVCLNTFVSGFDPQTAFAETLDVTEFALRHVLDLSARSRSRHRRRFRVGPVPQPHDISRGIRLRESMAQSAPYLLKSDIIALKTPKAPPVLPEIAGPAVVEPADPALKAALDRAFEEPSAPPFRRTRAVVVVRDGKVIAERYAAGIGVDTQLFGFSLTKSVINALIGVMTQQGLTSPSMPAPIPEWRGADDPRREIEIEHLMRMTTGLDLDQTDSGFDPSSRMYLEDDLAAYASRPR